MTRIVPVLLAAGLAVAAAGCGSGKGKVTAHPVSGTVIYNGKPAAGVKVFFFPTDAPTVPDVPQNPHGVTGPDGSFTLTTFRDGDGAPEGSYQIILLWPAETSSEEESGGDQLLGWFNAVNSKLTAKVEPGGTVVPPIKVPLITKPPEALEGIPGRN